MLREDVHQDVQMLLRGNVLLVDSLVAELTIMLENSMLLQRDVLLKDVKLSGKDCAEGAVSPASAGSGKFYSNLASFQVSNSATKKTVVPSSQPAQGQAKKSGN